MNWLLVVTVLVSGILSSNFNCNHCVLFNKIVLCSHLTVLEAQTYLQNNFNFRTSIFPERVSAEDCFVDLADFHSV